MQAIVFNRYGSVDVLETVKMARPIPTDQEVLIKIHAAALNPIDNEIRLGTFKSFVKTRFPRIPGSDFAGEIVEVGKKAKGFKPGDRVYGMKKTKVGGAYAEYVCITPGEIGLMPQGLSYEEAAALPLAALTSLQALRDLGKIEPGMELFLNGASGGVGVFAIQLAKIYQATVTAVCSYRNIEMVQELGADVVIDYTKQNILETDKRYDIFYDAYGNKSYPWAKHMLKPKGRYVSTIPNPRNFRYQFLTIFSAKKAKVVLVKSNTRDLDELRMFVKAGKLKPIIDRSYPLTEAREAAAYLETRRAKGKVILLVETRTEL